MNARRQSRGDREEVGAGGSARRPQLVTECTTKCMLHVIFGHKRYTHHRADNLQ